MILTPSERAQAEAAAVKQLPRGAAETALEIFAWFTWWKDQGYKPTAIDAQALGRKPHGLRQEFYNLRSHLTNFPQLTTTLLTAYSAEELAELRGVLFTCSFNITETHVNVSRAGGIGGLIGASAVITHQTKTPRARFEEWLATDLAQPFVITNEPLDKDHIGYFEMKTIELKPANIIVETTPTGVSARKI